ncbi:hypothetical protein E5288_WYG018847 [Bos mutus]|uniref:Uncharacterized protein n=1 Tax=Bos mutus TaxID=72004 RepID=A0A6B0QYX6_9CETA|nr:hypothetical protein [Bos mutus]
MSKVEIVSPGKEADGQRRGERRGLELTFFSGVYGTCIGAINKFGTEEKSLIGLSGIFIGIGEILDVGPQWNVQLGPALTGGQRDLCLVQDGTQTFEDNDMCSPCWGTLEKDVREEL